MQSITKTEITASSASAYYHTHTHTHTCAYHTHTHTHTNTYTHTYTHIHTHIYAYPRIVSCSTGERSRDRTKPLKSATNLTGNTFFSCTSLVYVHAHTPVCLCVSIHIKIHIHLYIYSASNNKKNAYAPAHSRKMPTPPHAGNKCSYDSRATAHLATKAATTAAPREKPIRPSIRRSEMRAFRSSKVASMPMYSLRPSGVVCV
jgi:hypothetical protein